MQNLCQNRLHHIAMHISEAEVTAGMTIGQAFVIDTEEVKDSGLEIMHRDNVFGDVIPQFITRTMNHAALNSCTGKPRTINS